MELDFCHIFQYRESSSDHLCPGYLFILWPPGQTPWLQDFIVCTCSSLCVRLNQWSCDQSFKNWNSYFEDLLQLLTFWCSLKWRHFSRTSEFYLVMGTTVQWTFDLGGSLGYLGGNPCCCWKRIMRPRSWRIDECLSKVSFICRSKSCFVCQSGFGSGKAFFAGLMAFPFGSFRLEFALAVLAR